MNMAKRKSKIKTSTASKIFDVFNILFMLAFAFVDDLSVLESAGNFPERRI